MGASLQEAHIGASTYLRRDVSLLRYPCRFSYAVEIKPADL